MNWLHIQMALLDAAVATVGFGVNWFLQSTIIMAIGLATGRLLRRRGSAAQSVVYPTTLVAALVCPLASWVLSLAGVPGWSMAMPKPWTYEQSETIVADAALPLLESSPANLPAGIDAASAAPLPGENGELRQPPVPETLPVDDPASQSIDRIDANVSSPVAGKRSIEKSAAPPTQIGTFSVHVSGWLTLAIAGTWLLVSTTLFARLATAWRRLSGLCRGAAQANAETVQTCRELAAAFAVAAPEVLRSPCLPSPCLAGIRRAAVLLPEADLSLPVRDVLIHELAHLARRDCHWNLLRQLALSAFFFQPLLWKLSRRLETTAEEVCDDYVVQHGGDRREYSHRLVDIAELSSAPMAAAGVGIVSLRSMLAKRVERIMDSSRSLSTRVGSLLLTLVLAGGLVGTTIVGLVGIGPQRSVAEVASKSGESKSTDDDQHASDASAPADAEGDANALVIRGTVLDPDGKQLAGADVRLFRNFRVAWAKDFPGLEAKSDASGRFAFELSKSRYDGIGTAHPWPFDLIVARAPGYAPAFAPYEADRAGTQPAIRLVAITPIEGRIVDREGRPVPHVQVGVTGIRTNVQSDPTVWLDAIRDGTPDAVVPKASKMNISLDDVDQPGNKTQSDADGRFRITAVGRGRVATLRISSGGIVAADLDVVNWPMEPLTTNVATPGMIMQTFYGAEFQFAAEPSQPIEGVVRDAASGELLAGVRVLNLKMAGQRSMYDNELAEAVGDQQGKYRLEGMPKGEGNEIFAMPAHDQPYLTREFKVPTAPAFEPIKLDLELHRGMLIRGSIRDKVTSEPIDATIIYLPWPDNPHIAGLPEFNSGRLMGRDDRCWTDAEGRFTLVGLPGRGLVGVIKVNGQPYPRGQGFDQVADLAANAEKFKSISQLYTPDETFMVAVKDIQPAEDQAEFSTVIELERGDSVKLKIVDEAGMPVSGATVDGTWPNSMFHVEVGGPVIEAVGLKAGEKRWIHCNHVERNLGGVVRVELQDSGPAPVPIELRTNGKIQGRLVDAQGKPLYGVQLSFPIAGIDTRNWAPGPVHPDKEGRFVNNSVSPGGTYDVNVHAEQWSRQNIAEGLAVEPGETIDLGTIDISSDQRPAPVRTKVGASANGATGATLAANASPPQAAETAAVAAKDEGARRYEGQVVDPSGKPVAGAHVAVLATKIQTARGGDLTSGVEALAEGKTDGNGHYELSLDGASSKTHRYANLIARKDGFAIAWQQLNIDAKTTESSFALAPEELIRGRLVDSEGQPAAGVRLSIRDIRKRSGDGVLVEQRVEYYGGKDVPAAWLQPVTSNEEGRFTLNGVPAGHGVYIEVAGSDRFAPQDIALNTGISEQRGKRDATYRSLVKNAAPGDEALLPLAPAQVFEGLVTYEDTGEPAGHARLTIWASQQEFGSMVLVAGKADDRGRYRISAHPGIRFGITAYPPDGTAYLARQTPSSEAIQWQAGDRVKQVDVRLPRGILVRGTVAESGTNAPVAGASIQYHPESANNPHTADDILTGWEGIQLSGEQGKFEIVVLPGPGRLLVHGPQGRYVLQEVSEFELRRGKPGGQRNYANAIQRIEPAPGADLIDVAISIRPGATVAGPLFDEQGGDIEEAFVITRLNVSPASPWWRGHTPPTLGGKFELSGLDPDQEYTVYFLDAKRRLGATQMLRASSGSPTVVLKPCGQASARFVDSQGQSHVGFEPGLHMVVTPGELEYDLAAARLGKLAADAEFVANIDRTNYWPGPQTDNQGRVNFQALIPGATYRLDTFKDGKPRVLKQFSVKSGEQLDLGELSVDLDR